MHVGTRTEPDRRAVSQRARRMARRRCGSCGEPATTMMSWSGQTIPICGACLSRLNAPVGAEPFCAFHEVQPAWLRPADGPSGTAVETNSPTDLAGLLRGIWKWVGD